MNKVRFPKKVKKIFDPMRFKVLVGGRGSAKSYSVIQYLIISCLTGDETILCTREFQNSIRKSVYSLIKIVATDLGVVDEFKFMRDEIICEATGSNFLFAGLNINIESIKSIPKITKCFVEEANTISRESLEILIPTIRDEGSEIIFVLNPDSETDPVYADYILRERDDTWVCWLNWQDNPYLPKVLLKQIEKDQEYDYEKYMHIWEGKPKSYGRNSVFGDRVVVKTFHSPPEEEVTYRFGCDWGFSTDPMILLRCFEKDDCLYIDYESWGKHVEIDDFDEFFERVPLSKKYVIKADNARPELISHMRNRNYNIVPGWKGKIEAGVDYIKNYKNVVIHPRCENTAHDFMEYRYKVDKKTDEILPVLMDKDNHATDATRYALDTLIKQSSGRIINW